MEFKAEVVAVCQHGDRSIGPVERDSDLTETAVRDWVRQAERDSGSHEDGGLTSTERQELAQLRRENRRLWEDARGLPRARQIGEVVRSLAGLVAGLELPV